MLAFFSENAPFGINLFFGVMLALLPLMVFGIRLAAKGKLVAHGRVMGVSFFLFLAALIAFEWAAQTMENRPPIPVLAMTIHLCFAIPGLLLWTMQIIRGRKASQEPKAHARRGRIVFVLLVATVGTGIWVYRLMFA